MKHEFAFGDMLFVISTSYGQRCSASIFYGKEVFLTIISNKDPRI